METLELKVLDSSLSHMKWRLKHSSRRRLETDVVALCRRIRPVIMVDYGGKLPQLQHNLSSLLQLCRNRGPPFFDHLRVMLIEDMIYLLHVSELASFVRSPKSHIVFVDLQRDPPEMIEQHDDENPLVLQLTAIQKLFSLRFPSSGDVSEVIDFSSCMQDTDITLPTLNGWLLGYPVVYLFSKDRAGEAIHNLSMKYLHLYTISVCRNRSPSNKQAEVEELLSFSVPYGLSMRGSKEEWAQAFLAHLQEKWEGCKDAWKSFQLDVTEVNPQAIVL